MSEEHEDQRQLTWRRPVLAIALLAAIHYLVLAGPATWVAFTQVPTRCWSGSLHDWRVVQDEPNGGDCERYAAAFIRAYAGESDEDTRSSLTFAEHLLLRLPVIAAAGLVGSVNMLIDGHSWFGLFVSMHAVGALLWAIGVYGIWSGIQAASRRRRGT